MAARDNQSYLIAVICLVVVLLGLGVATFFGWSKAAEYAEGMAKLESDLAAAEKLQKASEIESEILRAYIGDLGETLAEVPTKEKSFNAIKNDSSLTEQQKSAVQNVAVRLDDIKKLYDTNMRQFIARTEEEQAAALTWTALVKNLSRVTATKHNDLEVARRQNEQDKLDFQNKLAANQKTLDQIQDRLDKKNEELETAKTLYAENEKTLNKALNTAQAELRKTSQAARDMRKKLKDQLDDLETTKGELLAANESLKNKVADLTRENFDLADGRVLRVAGNRVFLNIGRDDGLRSNMTFAVYDSGINNFEKNQEKAKIEVLAVTGPHTARAKITEQDLITPITAGDHIVTPTWDPGYRVPIALSGFIDLDSDGNSDRLRFVRMIEKNGGRVVAQIDEQGNIIGKIDSSTRYFVKADAPQPGTLKKEALGNIYNSMRTLEKAAEDNTVQIVDLRKMMNWMGLHNTSKIVRTDGKSLGTGYREPTPADVPTSPGNSTR